MPTNWIKVEVNAIRKSIRMVGKWESKGGTIVECLESTKSWNLPKSEKCKTQVIR